MCIHERICRKCSKKFQFNPSDADYDVNDFIADLKYHKERCGQRGIVPNCHVHHK